MSKKSILISLIPVVLFACSGGFEKFAPPANSISGRGAKQNPKIISTTPTDGASVSPVTGTTGSQLRVIFDMTMNTTTTPVINTYVKDIESSSTWYPVSNSGATFTWSSTNFANDTLTIQLGWVRWPENNIIGFDFKNESLINLDEMPLSNDKIYSFTVTWNPGRYKTVHTGQWGCVYYSPVTHKWEATNSANCVASGVLGDPAIGTQDFPAGQNGFVDPMNPTFGPTLYGAGSSGTVNGRRFPGGDGAHPQNVNTTNCNGLTSDSCYPYSVDSVTNLVWKTCSQTQAYTQNVAGGDRCLSSGSDFTWGEAVNACASLNTADSGQGYGGRRDWRLPTLEELESLVDYGAHVELGAEGFFEMPAIHGYAADMTAHGPFPNTRTEKGYWTATGISLYNSGSTYYSNAYAAEFKEGFVGAGGSSGALLESTRRTTNRKKVRCVAGPTIEPSAATLTPSVVIPPGSANLTNASIPFTGYNPSPGFTLNSATPGLNAVTHTLKLDILNIPANGSITAVPLGSSGEGASLVYNNGFGFKTAATNPSLYCIDVVGSPTCPTTSALTIQSITVPSSTSDNTVTLKISAPGAQTYRLYVSPFPIATTPCSPTCTTTTPSTQALTVNTAIFRGYSLATFDVSSAVPTSATSVNVVFNKVPDTTSATNIANYAICPTAAWCGSNVTAATLSGRTVTLTTPAQTTGNTYYVVVQNVTFLGNHIVTDSVNRKIWQRCRHGVHDNPTCADDGVGDNDLNYWNDNLNYCNSLNAANFANYNSGWRAPTINELKSIADRSRLGTLGASIDTTIFPTPNVMAEDFASSTNKMKNGQTSTTSIDHAWTFNFWTGFPGMVKKDYSELLPVTLKPQQKSIRCVRTY